MRWYQDPKTVRRVMRHVVKRLHEGRSPEEIQEETKLPMCAIDVVVRSPLAPRPPWADQPTCFDRPHSRPIFVPTVVLDKTK